MKYWLASFYGSGLKASSRDRHSRIYGKVFRIYESEKETIAKFEKLAKKKYSYRWPDGWWIGVEFSKLLSASEYNKTKRLIAGDLGYSWIIDNIIDHGTTDDLDENFIRKAVEGNEEYLQSL